MSSTDETGGHVVSPTPTEARYLAIEQSAEFQDLRKRYRGWVIPVAVLSLAWYALYVLLAAYATDFMSNKVLGNINVGLIMGLLQFVSTFLVTFLYVRYADKVLDPASARIRAHMDEGGPR